MRLGQGGWRAPRVGHRITSDGDALSAAGADGSWASASPLGYLRRLDITGKLAVHIERQTHKGPSAVDRNPREACGNPRQPDPHWPLLLNCSAERVSLSSTDRLTATRVACVRGEWLEWLSRLHPDFAHWAARRL